jgi:hypothetical protein
VPARTVSTLLADWKLTGARINLLKIDIEGAEGPVLASAGEWLECVDHLIVEVHPPAASLDEVLARLNSTFVTVRRLPRPSTKPLLVASR